MKTGVMPLRRLHIEITNICNFACEFCPETTMQRRRGHMSLAMLRQILTEVAEFGLAEVVTYHLMGEPLIHPQIFAAIAIANELNLNLHITTNGSTLALRPEHHEHLLASAPPKVTISLQTPEPDTYGIRGAPTKLSATALPPG